MDRRRPDVDLVYVSWPADQYLAGQQLPSFDKQFVRDWLEASGWNKQAPGPQLPPDIVAKDVSTNEAMTWLPMDAAAAGGWFFRKSATAPTIAPSCPVKKWSVFATTTCFDAGLARSPYAARHCPAPRAGRCVSRRFENGQLHALGEALDDGPRLAHDFTTGSGVPCTCSCAVTLCDTTASSP